ncbi:CPBP family intramembrane glutamic endopeptidase [Halopseudomonas pelagia]|uniref:CPBP family intramembrane metalloprotease n=1 Tax=Halopseudomonas pelagia TaxID=553151 RepID=A0AA91U5R9_9GAMM|nr:type II CAAX endopeptidase family protein [Halopseudomonas pelagia]PCD01275.1 CPBP family intramembrane metalloprotease [Halopseudomonas pelagia]QFY57565.1 CPBP family intramembrane metalloprotease [Halopseudomonas pelagia]
METITNPRLDTPGWPEVAVGLIAYVVLLVPLALAFGLLPHDQPVLLGVIGSTVGGLAGTGAFAAAVGLRIRSLRPFGFKPVATRWLIIAAGLGIAGYGLNLIIQSVYVAFFGYDDPQGILHAAARGGALPFIASLIGGAVFTPFGEEVLFRGVVANALNRYGLLAGVGLSSIIFGLAHGVSVILPVAIMVGALSAILFRQTGAIWPCIILHGVYNGANSVASALSFTPMQ